MIVVNDFTTIDKSVTDRRKLGDAKLLVGSIKAKETTKPYPLMCSPSGGKGIE
jgi:hypothetical protein